MHMLPAGHVGVVEVVRRPLDRDAGLLQNCGQGRDIVDRRRGVRLIGTGESLSGGVVSPEISPARHLCFEFTQGDIEFVSGTDEFGALIGESLGVD
ncbi:MAG: hypothetical protein J2P18_20020 [Nocardia sp.]|nr:hypothetical protein [Nocardia sp.]